MPSAKTALTELGTAVGLCYEPQEPWPESVEALEIPGIDPSVWHPLVLPATQSGARDRELLFASMANGRAFRRVVLGGARPRLVEWTGADKTVWSSEIPRDLTIDRVWFIQAKHDSTCVLNTSPFSAFEHLLAETDSISHDSWYGHVAPLELQAYYDAARQATLPTELPLLLAELTRDHRDLLKRAMRDRPSASPDEETRYHDLCDAVSRRSAHEWVARLNKATPGQRTRMLLRMLRIAGGPYWLLGTKGSEPLRLEVSDSRVWRRRFELKAFDAEPAAAGQPQVNWRAEVVEIEGRAVRPVDGYCEVRWSHGKLQGSPECKVQVTTDLADLPGYDPMT